MQSLWASIRRELTAPPDYTNQMCRRDIVSATCEAAVHMARRMIPSIFFLHGESGLSLRSYLHYMSDMRVPGDLIMAALAGYRFGCPLTIVRMPECIELRVLHEQSLASANIVLLWNGQTGEESQFSTVRK